MSIKTEFTAYKDKVISELKSLNAKSKDPDNGTGNLAKTVAGEKKVSNSRFDINSFKSEFAKNSALPNHSYLVTFSPFAISDDTNSGLTSFLSDNSATITMRCDSAHLPGPRLITNDEVRRYGYGPVETVPHGVQFTNISLSWIIDSNAAIVQFFNTWMNLIVNYKSFGGADMASGTTYGSVNYSPYELGYKDSYVTKITIFAYDNYLNEVIEYSLYDAFPVTIHDVAMSWNDTDQLMKYTVDFAYTDLSVSTPKSTIATTKPQPVVASPNQQFTNTPQKPNLPTSNLQRFSVPFVTPEFDY
jgi:hypothetical protein